MEESRTVTTPEAVPFDPAALIEAHQAGVWRYLRALGCDPALADDLTQDTFLAVLERPFRHYSEAATAAYLRKVAFNRLVTVQRRAGRVTAVENLEQLDHNWSRWAAEDQGEALLETLKECFGQLGHRAQLALRLRFHDRRPRVEIAEALGISEHGAKNLMQRAKRQLRDCLEGKLK